MFGHGYTRICADPKPGDPETIYRECGTEEFKRVSAVTAIDENGIAVCAPGSKMREGYSSGV